jgi:hypothetical protein
MRFIIRQIFFSLLHLNIAAIRTLFPNSLQGKDANVIAILKYGETFKIFNMQHNPLSWEQKIKLIVIKRSSEKK